VAWKLYMIGIAPQLGMFSCDPKGNDKWMLNFIVFKVIMCAKLGQLGKKLAWVKCILL
jgi:hypothetical protein